MTASSVPPTQPSAFKRIPRLPVGSKKTGLPITGFAFKIEQEVGTGYYRLTEPMRTMPSAESIFTRLVLATTQRAQPLRVRSDGGSGYRRVPAALGSTDG